MNDLQISKLRDRWCCNDFLNFLRRKLCCACNRPASASHMISKKFGAGSDSLAVNACIFTHHVQSTRTSREILERAGIDIEKLHCDLWREYLLTKGVRVQDITQQEFERIVTGLGLSHGPKTTRANWKQGHAR